MQRLPDALVKLVALQPIEFDSAAIGEDVDTTSDRTAGSVYPSVYSFLLQPLPNRIQNNTCRLVWSLCFGILHQIPVVVP